RGALAAQVFVHAAAAGALALVGGAAVLAREKAAREPEVRQDRDALAHAERHELFLDVALHQVVLGLLRGEPRRARARALRERLLEARAREVRRADRAHFARFHELLERAD